MQERFLERRINDISLEKRLTSLEIHCENLMKEMKNLMQEIEKVNNLNSNLISTLQARLDDFQNQNNTIIFVIKYTVGLLGVLGVIFIDKVKAFLDLIKTNF